MPAFKKKFESSRRKVCICKLFKFQKLVELGSFPHFNYVYVFSKCLDSKEIQNFGTFKYGNQSDGVNSQCFLCVCVGTVVVARRHAAPFV